MMNNRQLADTFTLIANFWRSRARSSTRPSLTARLPKACSSLGREANEYWKEGKLREIPGVGKAIAEKIDELLRTGKLEFLEKLKKEVPESLAEWLQGARAWAEEDRA